MADMLIRVTADLSSFRAAVDSAQSVARNAATSMRTSFDQAVGSFKQWTREVQGLGTAAERAAKQPRDELGRFTAQGRAGVDGLAGGFGNLGRALGGLAAAYAALNAIKAMTRIADEAALTTARIQGLTGSIEETRQAQAQLYEMAQRLQAPYGEAANSFARMLPAVQQLGGGVAQTTRLTEILLTTAKLSGASATEAAASATQFAQGLASGVLQGDELKSILENNSTLARTLAGSLGVTIGELRKLGEEGKLTADVVGNALLDSYDQIKAQSAGLPATVGGAWTTIENAFTQMVVAISSGTGVFGSLGQVLMEVARAVEAFTVAIRGAGEETQSLEDQKAAQEFAQGVGRAFAYMGDVIGAVTVSTINALRAMFGILQALGDAWSAIGRAFMLSTAGDFSGAASIMGESMGKARDAFVNFAETGAAGVRRNLEAIIGQGPALAAYNKLLEETAQKAGEAADTSPVARLSGGTGGTAASEAEQKKAAAARMAAWEAELDAQRLAHARLAEEQGTYEAFSKAQEVAFWQERLAGANLTALDRAAIEKRLTALTTSELEARNAAALAADRRMVESQRQADAIRASMAEMRALAAVDAEQQEAQARLDTRQITDAQYLDLEQQFEAQRYEIRRQAVADSLELAKAEGRDPAEVERINAELLQLELDYQLRRRQIQLEQQQAGGESGLAGLLPDTAAFESALTTMFDMTQTWAQKMQSIFNQIAAVFMRKMIIEPIAEWMMRYVRETALYRMLAAQQVATQAGASAAVVGIKSGEAMAVVGANAAEAASGGAAAMAPIPFVGPGLAIGAFAALMALTLGARSLIKSAAGGYDIPAGLNPVTQLHAEEMVLPAEHANTIRTLSAQGGAQPTVNVEVRGESVGGWLLLHKSELAKAMKAAHRGFAFT